MEQFAEQIMDHFEVQPISISDMRTRHHYIAQAVAQGRAPQGISAERVALFQRDPAFQELVATYKAA